MLDTTRTAGGLLLVALGLTGCGGSESPLPSAPSPVVPVAAVVNTSSPTGYGPGVMLSGVVHEITATGLKPLEGATVYCDACGEQGHTWATTDRSGFYSFKGLWTTSDPTPLHVTKVGYDDPPGQPRLQRGGYSGQGWREVMVNDRNMRFDMELVKQR